MSDENKATRVARRRYDRIAPVYDVLEGMMERASFNRWRKLLWSQTEGSQVLEIGVGTGKNLAYYPTGVDITAIDFSPKMLERARRRAAKLGIRVRLEVTDVQNMGFPDNSFDTAVASFVFCSVPDPLRGLQEVRRVLRPGGKLVLLEHVLSSNRVLAALMQLANPLVSRVIDNINRRTVATVAHSGLKLEKVTDLAATGIVKLIEARKVDG